MPPFEAEIVAARRAQEEWRKLAVRDRLVAVRKFRHRLVERRNDVTAAIMSDVGRPVEEVLGTDFLPTASACRFLERRAETILRPRRVSSNPLWLSRCRSEVHHRPHGVVGIIGTWNYPLFLNATTILHAVAAGNAVLWKPSEQTPRFAEVLANLFREAGFPDAVITTLPATREAGPQLADANIDFLHFTGSDVVGRKIATKLGERLIPSVMELSGIDAVFVLADANVKLAARSCWYGATINRGQTCLATRRVFVHRAAYDAFVTELRPLVEASGPMSIVLATEIERMGKFTDDAALSPQATLLRPTTTSRIPAGSVLPTVILNASADMAICQQATFLPVVAAIPFDDIDDAIKNHNRSVFGLAASIFTADQGAAERLAESLAVGSVVVNDVIAPIAHPETPFGGRGASGWGVTQGEEGLLQMTVPQVVARRAGTFRPHVDSSVKHDPASGDVLEGMLQFTQGRGFRTRWRGFWQMLRGFRRFGK